MLPTIERRARLPIATGRGQEAVDLATEQGQEERGRALLERAVIAARGSGEDHRCRWAVAALAELRVRGHFEQARTCCSSSPAPATATG
jgi:hypothetical protein